jgi:methylated-DNA-[protein]-cysteine S-methyltransferase
MNETLFDVVPTALGPLAVTLRAGRVIQARWGRAAAGGADRRRLPEARRWVAGALAGRPGRPPLDLPGATAFERRVYAVVRRIARGRTMTYGEVARAAGRPGAARAVGRAMARNPICLFIP